MTRPGSSHIWTVPRKRRDAKRLVFLASDHMVQSSNPVKEISLWMSGASLYFVLITHTSTHAIKRAREIDLRILFFNGNKYAYHKKYVNKIKDVQQTIN